MTRHILGSLALVTIFFVITGFGCNQSSGPSQPQTSAGAYAGTWILRHVETTTDGTCGDTLGVEKTEAPFSVDSNGHFTIVDEHGGSGATGLLTSDGVVSANLPGDAAGLGSCPAGTASGTCATTDSCAGTYAQGGNHGNFTMVRLVGTSLYAGTWTLTHVETSADSGACDEGDTLGVPKTEGPFAVDVTGYFALPDSNHTPVTGSISAGGAVTAIIPPDSPGGGSLCPAGTATGNCASTDSCSGTYSKAGHHGTFTLVRVH